jgi:hypothetical protein
LNFARIYEDTILGNGVPQEFHTLQPEFTFGELSIKLMISQKLKDNSEMFGMFLLIFGINEDIAPGVDFSVRLIPWVAYDKVFWKWV